MSLVSQLSQGESVSKQKAIKVAIVDVGIGAGLGIVQGVVQSKDRIIMGSVRLSQLVPILEIVGGTATMVMTKNNSVRSIASKAVIAGSTILGYTVLSPQIVSIVNGLGNGTVNQRRAPVSPHREQVKPSTLGFTPNAYYS